MTKRELIDEIMVLNHSAAPSFLAEFDDGDLSEYLANLIAVRGSRPLADSRRGESRFNEHPRPAASADGADSFPARTEDSDAPQGPVGREELGVLVGSSLPAGPRRSRALQAVGASQKWLF